MEVGLIGFGFRLEFGFEFQSDLAFAFAFAFVVGVRVKGADFRFGIDPHRCRFRCRRSPGSVPGASNFPTDVRRSGFGSLTRAAGSKIAESRFSRDVFSGFGRSSLRKWPMQRRESGGDPLNSVGGVDFVDS